MKEQLYQEVRKKCVNWEKVEELIKGLGSSINDIVNEDTLLSDLYHYLHRGNAITRLTEIFLRNGYDVSGNDGFNGAKCLRALCWSTYDHYILHAAEMLLDAGADSRVQITDDDPEDTRGVEDSIEWKLSYWNMGECDVANMFEAYYLMVERHQAGKSYKNIRAVRECVGRKLTKIEKLILKNQDEEDDNVSNSFRGAYLLTCENTPVVVSDSMEAIINPYIGEDMEQRIDVSHRYSEILGKRIRGIRFTGSNSFQINLDDGYRISFCNDYLMGIEEAAKGYITVSCECERTFISSGTLIERIYLSDGYRHGEFCRTYEESNVFLRVDDKAYRIYAEGDNEKGRLRIDDVPIEACRNLRRSVMGRPFVYEGCFLRGKAIKTMQFVAGDEVLYLTPAEREGVKMFLVDKKDDLEEEGYGKMKKIEFVVESNR